MRELWQLFEKKNQDVNIDECGIQQFHPNDNYQYIAYQNFILHYVEKGKGIYIVDGKKHELKAGDGFIIRKGMSVTYSADEQEPWKNYWVGLSGQQLTKHLDETILLQDVVLSFEEDSKSAKLIKNICQRTLRESPNKIKNSWYLGKVYQLLYHLSKEFKLSEKSNKKTQTVGRNYAKIAFDYIYNNFMYSITIQEIADYIGIDRSYLYRIFKKEYGISPQQFLLSYRMEEAKRLLIKTNESVYVIANKVGYNDQLQFSKAFKKHSESSPMYYREKNYKEIINYE